MNKKKTENLERELAVLSSLRSYTEVLQARLPLSTPQVTVEQLVDKGWFTDRAPLSDCTMADLAAVAERLARQGLLGRNTMHTVRHYFLMEAGAVLLARLEKEAGLTELHAAQVAEWQAADAERLARERGRIAAQRVEALLGELPAHRTAEDLLLSAALGEAAS